MKRYANILIILLLSTGFLYSQDVIIRKDGKSIIGKITKEDSTNVYITTIVKAVFYDTFISRSKIVSIKYGVNMQSSTDPKLSHQTITIRNTFLGKQHFFGGQYKDVNEIKMILKTNPQALELFVNTFATSAFADICEYGGGFMIGYSIGQWLIKGNNKFNWSLLGIGAGVTLISIPISISAQKQRKLAVDVYNNSIIQKGKIGYKEDINPSITGSGICLRFSLMLTNSSTFCCFVGKNI